jgi:hypothetical protein
MAGRATLVVSEIASAIRFMSPPGGSHYASLASIPMSSTSMVSGDNKLVCELELI